MIKADRFYSISEAAQKLGVSISTLRRWEREGKISIGRTPGGKRLFSEQDLELLSSPIKVELEQKRGFKISSPKLPPRISILTLLLIIAIISNFYLLFLTSLPQQAVLGVETFIAPAIAEGTPLGNLLGRVGSIFQRGTLVVTLIGKDLPTGRQGELDKEGNLNIKGKAIIAKDIEGLSNLRIKGEIISERLKTNIIDPYLIENDGNVQPYLEIRTLPSTLGSADIVFTPGNIETLRIKEGGDVVFDGNVSGIGSLNTKSLTTSSDLRIGGNITLTGSINGNTLTETKLVFQGSSPSIYPSTTNSGISINGNGTGAINIGNSGTGDVYIAGGSGDSGCTITNSNGSLNCSSNITTQADLDVRGGDLTTNQTTFSLINTTATTLNIGGAATTITMGATSGTLTLRNSTISIGTSTLSGTTSTIDFTNFDVSSGGNTTIGGTLSVTGATTLSSTLSVGGNLTFSTDNSFDIGASGATRPRNIYAGTSFIAPLGSGSASSYSFTGDANTGMFSGGPDDLRFTTGGFERMQLTGGQIVIPAGSGPAPVITFQGDLDTGIHQNGADAVGIATAGVSRWQVNPSGHLLAQLDNNYDIGASGATRPRTIRAATAFVAGSDPASFDGGSFFAADGSITRPAFSFGSNRTAGMSLNAGALTLSTNAAERITISAGGAVQIVSPAAGLQVGVATGGDKGTGTINVATNIFKNDSAYTNPDYAFEHYFTGSIIKFAGNEGASDYPGLLPLSDVEAYAKQNFQLPRVGDKKGIFDRADIVLEKVEELFLYGFDHEKRITGLESSNKNLLTVVGIPQPTTSTSLSASDSASVIPSPTPTPASNPVPSILSRLDSLEELVLSFSSSTALTTSASASASFDNLTVLKKLLTNDLGITGKITAGLLAIDGLAGSINSLSELKLQDQQLGGIDILAGKIVIDKEGNIKAQNSITAQRIDIQEIKVGLKSSGTSILPAHTTSLEVTAESATENARILLTPTVLTDKVLTVTQKGVGKFTVSIKEVEPQDIHFDWFIVN